MTTEFIIERTAYGFDAVGFFQRGADLSLRRKIGLLGEREAREQAEFEAMEPETRDC